MMDNFDNRPQAYGEVGIYSTAGAVPIKNDKGEISMQKVKVQRYISGKRPDYARRFSDSESEEEEEDFVSKKNDARQDDSRSPSPSYGDLEALQRASVNDPRLRRLLAARIRERDEEAEGDDEDRVARLKRRRMVQEPEVVDDNEEEDRKPKLDKPEDEEEEVESEDESDDSDDSDDEEVDEDAIARRRELMRQRALYKAQAGDVQEEMLPRDEEKSGPESEEEETSEEETDSEEEEGARLKPVFVRAKDRLTIQEREREEAKARQLEKEAARAAEERRRQTLRMVEDEVRKVNMAERAADDGEGLNFEEVNTDDENDEIEYEGWKVRELKRLKRDREEEEQLVRELEEAEKFRNLTEDEKRLELRVNPKQITNKSAKGKYKFLQKYYHRGVFYLDEEDARLKRDFTAPTLEDNFNKSVLPKVMQVKNFGRSGRTKYTHLVDQDTTDYDASWTAESASNIKFQQKHAAGMKQVFERPGRRKN